ncbi:beta-ketoacyl-[acyl-carrier-protein] synthase family protein [Streptomyces sp. NPDC048191]|uniref:beta-ketoacyl-[acyl-carrier-protein] synthase family protein n=1 Tax=Streptomyces sp. NPDC048191 TaxID=3155484 RepID=UPI0033D9AF38
MTGAPAVAVTGLGLITPAGDGTRPTWEEVCRGRPAAAADPRLSGLPVDFSCSLQEATALGRGAPARSSWRMSPVVKAAVSASHDAVVDAGLDTASWDATRVGVVVGCGIGDLTQWRIQALRLVDKGPISVSPLTMPMALPNMPAGEVALSLGIHGPSLATATACASGASALMTARGLLTSGLCDIVLAGGAEMAVDPLTMAAFHRMGALSTRSHDISGASRPFSPERDGFVMSEGAAILVLERTRDAAARGRRPRAYLAGCGASTDAYHPTSPHPQGAGSEIALCQALRDAGLAPADIDHVNAHATSTPLGDAAEAAMISRALPHGPTVTAPKGVLGHALGAAGAIEAALTVLTIEHQLVPPTANLDGAAAEGTLNHVTDKARPQRVAAAISNSFGFGGHNVVLAFTSDLPA